MQKERKQTYKATQKILEQARMKEALEKQEGKKK